MQRALTRVVIYVGLLGLVAGCSGGGGGGGDGDSTASTPALQAVLDRFVSAGAASASYLSAFNETAADQVRSSAEFAAQDRSVLIQSRPYDTFSYDAINAEYPLSVSLTGAGQTIAVVDSGFRLTHDELAGKTLSTFGSFNAEDHGTGVAAVAAGSWDGRGMMGVAPGASLHLSSYRLGFAGRADATLDALNKGAVVQNNSWGFVDQSGRTIPISSVQAYLAANPGESVAAAISATVGGSEADITRYIDALRAFTDRGVVVFAAPNETDTASLSVLDALPIVVPDLQKGWLVATSSDASLSGDEVVSARRLSAACLEMAHSCLAAEGVVYTADATSDTGYRLASGTSYAAPQISAGVALLAQAFPNLPASDLRRRLLASANNRFYGHTGETDFGNGVVHGFNEEFGHGFMDLKAALLPIGGVGLPTGNSAYGGIAPLGSAQVSAGPASGDALERALEGQSITVFDRLGTDFAVSAMALYGGTTASTLSERLDRFAAPERRVGGTALASFALSAGGDDAGWGWSLHAGESTDLLHHLGLVASETALPVGPASLAALAPDASAVGIKAELDADTSVSVFSVSSAFTEESWSTEADGVTASGGGVSLSQTIGASTLSFGASFLTESDALLGFAVDDPSGDLDALSGSLSLGFSTPLPMEDTSLILSAEFGMGESSGDGMVRQTGTAAFSTLGAAIRTRSVFGVNDALTLFARQPLRIESGSVDVIVPSGRTLDGTVTERALSVDLTPSARQVDLGFEYSAALGDRTQVRFGAALSHNEEHVAGETGLSIMGALRQTF
nr:S8 family peptidase [Chthonobacter rhizosphaerae]